MPTNYAAGPNPVSVAVGDFNGDGSQDFAVADKGAHTVRVFLGNGDGTFQPGIDYPVGPGPTSVAVGDFNGDGNIDLAVTNLHSGLVTIWSGQGDGSFQAGENDAVGPSPVFVAAGDFNGDSFPDLVVPNAVAPGTGTVLVNAADWQGAAAGQERPSAQRLPLRAPPSALSASHDLDASPQRPPTGKSLPFQSPDAMQAESDRGRDGRGTVTPTALVPAPRTQDSVFETWGDLELTGLENRKNGTFLVIF